MTIGKMNLMTLALIVAACTTTFGQSVVLKTGDSKMHGGVSQTLAVFLSPGVYHDVSVTVLEDVVNINDNGEFQQIAIDSPALLVIYGSNHGNTIYLYGYSSKLEFIQANGGNDDDFIANYSSHRCTILGEDGNDILGGGAASDNINGGPGNDTLYGHGSADMLIGGLGSDTLFGGDGDDYLVGNKIQGFKILPDFAQDTIRGDGGADQFVSYVTRWMYWYPTGNGFFEGVWSQIYFGTEFMVDYNPNSGDTFSTKTYWGNQMLEFPYPN